MLAWGLSPVRSREWHKIHLKRQNALSSFLLSNFEALGTDYWTFYVCLLTRILHLRLARWLENEGKWVQCNMFLVRGAVERVIVLVFAEFRRMNVRKSIFGRSSLMDFTRGMVLFYTMPFSLNSISLQIPLCVLLQVQLGKRLWGGLSSYSTQWHVRFPERYCTFRSQI